MHPSSGKKLLTKTSKSSSDLRQKNKSTLFGGSQRIKNETPRPTIQWNDVKTGFKHFKIKRWNSIGSWVYQTMQLK